MSKKILIITASPRARSNSDVMAAAFARGAQDAGNVVETVSLKGKDIRYCKGCLACMKTGRCTIQDDDTQTIVAKMRDAEVLVFASPVYYFGVTAQLKALLDRCNPIFKRDVAFRDIYLLTSAAGDEPEAEEKMVANLQGWVDCFPPAKIVGSLLINNIKDPGAVQDHPDLAKAYEMGRAID